MIMGEKTQAALRPRRRCPYSAWWLLAKYEHSRAEVLTADSSGERIMPVFSGEGEAEMFLWLGSAPGSGWHVRETSAGELASLLSGPYAGVRRVALDPSPEMAGTGTIGLVSMRRERFVGQVLVPGGRMTDPRQSRGPVPSRTTGDERPSFRFS